LLHPVPALTSELTAFSTAPAKRLYHGGPPPALLAAKKDPSFHREWLDSFFARDIQRLFAFRVINRFNALFEYVLHQSGAVGNHQDGLRAGDFPADGGFVICNFIERWLRRETERSFPEQCL